MKTKNQSIEFIKQYTNKKHIAILSLLSVVSSLLLVSVAFVLQNVITAVQLNEKNDIILFVLIDVLLLVLYAVTFGLTSFLQSKFSIIATKNVIASAHNHLLKSNYQQATKSHSVEQLKIIASDADIAVSSYIQLYPTIISIIVKLVAGIALMLYLSYQITLIALAIGLFIVLLLLLTKKPLKNMHKKAQESVAVTNAYMQESLKNIEVVKALNVDEEIKKGVESRLDNVKKAIEKRAKYLSTINASTYFMLEIVFLFILVYGGVLISQSKLTIASFIVLISIVEIVKTPFMTSTKISSSVFAMLASAERVLTITTLPIDSYYLGDFDQIVFKDVCFSYDNKKVISNFNLVINKNDKIAVCGVSGKGKTTFIRLLCGLIKPDSGEIYIVNKGEKIQLNCLLKVGYVPQNLQLFNDSIINNISCEENLSEQDIVSCLKLAGIYDTVIEKEDKLNTILKEGGTSLSQGQMQRLAIARALLSNSNLVVLDEPFSSLDKNLAEDIFNKLQNLDRTVIIVSHDEFVKNNSKIVVDMGDLID